VLNSECNMSLCHRGHLHQHVPLEPASNEYMAGR